MQGFNYENYFILENLEKSNKSIDDFYKIVCACDYLG
jgi:hypothetical protein